MTASLISHNDQFKKPLQWNTTRYKDVFYDETEKQTAVGTRSPHQADDDIWSNWCLSRWP